MKKIGVCACYNTKNYGSMLQTLATGCKLEELGYDYEFIRYTRKLTVGLVIKSLSRIPEVMNQKVKHVRQSKQLKSFPDIRKGIQVRNECFDSFMNNQFKKMSPKYDTFAQLQKAAEQYSAVVVGSDQLWRPEGYSTGFYNLLFVPEKVPKIAYATSFGVSQIPAGKQKIAEKFLKRIDHISVRELRASEMVRELTGREVPTVVDPTLLFNGEQWETIIPQKAVVSNDEKYIFCYFLGNNPEQRKKVQDFADAVGCKVVTIPHLDEFVACDVSFGDEQLYDVGPAEFVNLIRNAEYICTDSFHGTVFSILNHKKFVTFNRFTSGSKNSRNSRIESLLKQTGLETRRYLDTNEMSLLEVMDAQIDYNQVEEKVFTMRSKSIDYLKSALVSTN